MLQKDIADKRIRIISRGKLDAVAPLLDLAGMQKDRNAHFVIAEVEEVMIPYPDIPPGARGKAHRGGKIPYRKRRED